MNDMHKNIPTVAGLKTRFLCTISGQADSKLAGYVMVDGERHAMELSHGDTLTAPITPAGDYLYEIRSSGTVVLWGHLCARPSAFPPAEDITTIGINAEMAADDTVVKLDVVFPEGPRGQDGKSPYVKDGHVYYWDDAAIEWKDGGSLKGEPGNDGVAPTPAEVAEAMVPALSVDFAFEGPTASYNAAGNYFVLGSSYLQGGLMLTQFGWRVRFDNLNGCCTTPVYLGVWELGEDGSSWVKLGVSLDTQVQQLSSDIRWTFEPGDIRLSGRPLRFCLLANRTDEWRTDLIMAMRTATTADEETRVFSPGEYAAVPKFFFKGRKGPESINMGGGGGGRSIVKYTLATPREDECEDSQFGRVGTMAVFTYDGFYNARVRAIRGLFGSGPTALRIGDRISSVASWEGGYTPAEWIFDPPAPIDQMHGMLFDEREILHKFFVYPVDPRTGRDIDVPGIMYQYGSLKGMELYVGNLSSIGRLQYVADMEIDFEWGTDADVEAELKSLREFVVWEREMRLAADLHHGTNSFTTQIGESAYAGSMGATAVGVRAKAREGGSFALGYNSYINENGCGVLTVSSAAYDEDANVLTNLVLIGAETEVAGRYTGGEAGLGYVVRRGGGEIVERGCIRLSELCRERTNDFDPGVVPS